MSRSTRVFGELSKTIAGVVLCRDMLVVRPTENIVRGFLLETTLERERVYLWRVVVPLYRPMRSVFLDYSTRIPESGKDLYIRKADFQASVRAVGEIVSRTSTICRECVLRRTFFGMSLG
jgi:hypothetical protein